MGHSWQLAWLGLRDWIWPDLCWLCSASAVDGFCVNCRQQLIQDPGRACPRCTSSLAAEAWLDLENGCPRCAQRALAFQGAYRLGLYEGLLRDAILEMKHARGELLAYRLGELWARERPPAWRGPTPDVVLSLPLHRSKRWQRGYDQAAALAEGFAAVLQRPRYNGVLRRVRATVSQVEMTSPTARWENVRGAFEVIRPDAIQGKRIVLIDDVLTTGATCMKLPVL